MNIKKNNKLVNKKISVHAYKFNSWLYRTWEFPTVIEEGQDYLILSSTRARVISCLDKDSTHYQTMIKEPTIWFFFKNEWFNIIFKKYKNSHKLYINIASPFIIEENVIKYIDFELDLVSYDVIMKRNDLKLIDKIDFDKNKKAFKYPNSLVNKINDTVAKLQKDYKEKKLDKYFRFDLLEYEH